MEKNFLKRMLKRVNKKSNNEGSSIVLVIITMAFVGMLVAISLYMSYYNYLMKVTDRQSKENFYTAEEALAVINAGLQTVISDSEAVAYAYALQGDASINMELRKSNFQIKYEEMLINSLAVQNDNGHYKLNMLNDYLVRAGMAYNPATNVGAQLLTVENTPTQQGENTIFRKEGGIVLQNVKLMYTDEKGYITMISTDIRLRLPDVNLVISQGVPELENCSLIANDNLIVESNNGVRVSGNVYGGKDGLIASNDTRLSFEKKDSDFDNVLYRLVAGNITVENSTVAGGDTLAVSRNYEVWTEDVNVNSGKISLLGSTYVRDDLTVEGRNSEVTLAGNYYGYGDELYEATNSSAILVNGAATDLNFANLDNLMLSGHAYIGARHYDANKVDDDYIPVLEEEEEEEGQPGEDEEEEEAPPVDPDAIAKNDKDLMMGESVGVKSNQLIYMVPTECMGYYNGSTEQFLAKNPITYDEYIMLTQTYKYARNEQGDIIKDANDAPTYELDENGNPIPAYTEVNLNVVAEKLGKSISSMGATYKPVFRRVNGTVLVYYYLDFTSDILANQFFREYYAADKENMDAYIKMYIEEFNVNPALNAATANLHLAGNMIKYENDGTVSMVADTATEDALLRDELDLNREKWNDSFTAYSKKMLSSTGTLTTEQLARDIYDNLVIPEADFDAIVPVGQVGTFETGQTKAKVINNRNAANPYVLDYDGIDHGNVVLVIASGDVILNTNFKGLVLAGGTVQLGPNCNRVESDAVSVRQAMSAVNANGNRIAELLVDGEAYAAVTGVTTGNGNAPTEEEQLLRDEDYIKVSDLIVYENWTKQ